MFVKYQSNTEKHRNYITCHRNDDSYSSLYAAKEDQFITIGNNKDGKETVYKMTPMKKNLMENFLYVRNNMLLFSKSTVDANGKTTLVDKATGRPIYIGDGLIPQVERYANKFVYNKLTIDVIRNMMSSMQEKSDDPMGNHWVCICNEKFMQDVNSVLAEHLAQFKTDGTYMWSKDAGKYLKVGATFDSYEYLGNTISFKVDRTFSREFGYDKGYCLCLDLTTNKQEGTPAMAMYTFKGGDMIQNSVVGVGGKDGLSSGEVSTPVAGGKEIIHGYSGLVIYNPYKSYILRGI